MHIRTAVLVPLATAALLAAPWARADVAVIVSAHSSLAPSVEQVCQLFLGKIKTPTPVTLAEQNPVRDEFYSKACKKDPAQVRSMWGKLIFTGTGTPPREVASVDAMKKAIAADPNSIGYIDKKDLDASVKVIATVN
ncbi:MAG: phosphate ABC transporter substrate-binding protein [Gammaproteobacteria bacterium]